MGLLVFLILFPMVAALLLLAIKAEQARAVVTVVAALVTGCASIALACLYLPSGSVFFDFESEIINIVCVVVDLGISVVVISFAARYKNLLAGILGAVQIVLTICFELFFANGVTVAQGFYVDELSIIMALIIGVIGSGICVYALGYMQDFQRHEPEGAKDNRPYFFFLLFMFLGAMYLIVFSNNMSWMLTGWEITTVCSFLLIGYTKTEEAIRNSFRQIILNMIGGIAFTLALYWCTTMGTLSFAEFLEYGIAYPGWAIFPVTLLALAGLTKAAQMPFHSWLLGAMVAPTPTSALLHSSTMVKAGVFLLVKLAPIFAVCTLPKLVVIIVGGVTFLLCSILAIGQSNAKRVLAYSTIANLGLITACAGLGTQEAVWAAIFLIIFHAASKSLLFLCVGTAEHHIGSRNIEDMDNLFLRMPKLAKLMVLGIMGMFIAPFGMLISKWAVMVSFVDAGFAIFLVLIAFGSAATFMFWAKWMGKLLGIAADEENVELDVHKSEFAALFIMAALTILCCILMPVISDVFVLPYLEGVYGSAASTISSDNLSLLAIICGFVVIVLAGVRPRGGKKKHVDIYLSGASVNNEAREYLNSFSKPQAATYRNWYLGEFIKEARISKIGAVICSLIIVVGILAPYTYLLQLIFV